MPEPSSTRWWEPLAIMLAMVVLALAGWGLANLFGTTLEQLDAEPTVAEPVVAEHPDDISLFLHIPPPSKDQPISGEIGLFFDDENGNRMRIMPLAEGETKHRVVPAPKPVPAVECEHSVLVESK